MSVDLYPNWGKGGRDSWERGLALEGMVQSELEDEARVMANKAKANLAAHRSTGASYIELDRGVIDQHIILNDTRGLGAAMSIEYGRGPSDTPSDPFPNGTTPTYVLHDATQLPKKSVRPNSRRRKTIKPRSRRRRR